jgi:hypothetical protein
MFLRLSPGTGALGDAAAPPGMDFSGHRHSGRGRPDCPFRDPASDGVL